MRLKGRFSGLLLHITSLSSDFGIGDLGPSSHKFVDKLSKANQTYWSILPVTPTTMEQGNSPYEASSSFAGNTLLISPELLAEDGILQKNQLSRLRIHETEKINFELVSSAKQALIRKANSIFRKDFGKTSDMGGFQYETFLSENSDWLTDYCIYKVLRERSGEPWFKWPLNLRKRDPIALSKKTQSLKALVEQEEFAQFAFFRQWESLREHCRRRKVIILGDLPFYVASDSADTWIHPEIFKLKATGRPMYLSGVPPDYFSETGQLWGNPVYDWPRLKKESFAWWIERMQTSLKLFDLLRLDHFRGFHSYWQVPARAKTAKNGKWIRSPSKSFFSEVRRAFPALPFVAEDLGFITKEVEELVKQLGIPGMRVLVFGFDGNKENPHLPINYPTNCVVYTSTHDTNTVKGWFMEEATSGQKRTVNEDIGRKMSSKDVSSEFIRLALNSKAKLSIIPMPDILSLGGEARMNVPARRIGNWEWKLTAKQETRMKLDRLREMTEDSSRSS